MGVKELKVDLRSPKEIIVHDYRKLTLEEFVNSNQGSQAFAWIDGYLINFVHASDEMFDQGLETETWIYKAVEVAPMPKFEEIIQARHHKISVFDNTGIPIMQAIIDEVKKKK